MTVAETERLAAEILSRYYSARRPRQRALLELAHAPKFALDIELLRRHLAIDRWMPVGFSRGSTLGLAYAERHPHRVTELVLVGRAGWPGRRRRADQWLGRLSPATP